MATPPTTKRRGNRSTPPKAGGKKSKKELTPEVDEDEGGDEEEEYEIEEILDCKKGMFAPNRWAFYVSWKGYGPDDNSWVDEPDLYVPATTQERDNVVLIQSKTAESQHRGGGRFQIFYQAQIWYRLHQ
ncbi:hypothetical protein FRC00_001327 [Tulasnella sp. 408]|nr:hypothetical protein FRC00_001327 [Tulasnella sp. 408]